MLETSSQRFFADFAGYQPDQIAVGDHRDREDQREKIYVRSVSRCWSSHTHRLRGENKCHKSRCYQQDCCEIGNEHVGSTVHSFLFLHFLSRVVESRKRFDHGYGSAADVDGFQ